jgi:hypothetical protein
MPTAGVNIPPPTYPMVVHMISDPMFPPDVDPQTKALAQSEPIAWVISKPHPFVSKFTVMRMFLAGAVVEVYSISEDHKVGMRDVIPIHAVRLVQESMPIDIFIEELVAAENADNDAGDLAEPVGPDTAPAPAANGQQQQPS